MPPDKPKVTRITIEREDGSVVGAEGEAAERVMSWWDGCETMAFVHGMQYDGPTLKPIDPKPNKNARRATPKLREPKPKKSARRGG